ncbi:type 2 lanthipeptide synthetase LanM family protein [Actinomadura rupiterrae]|uniref:type 2 lanthipeptide synthetase LanM family protein n=1 Tax=Actinomadura rupiterrae TaxID=559627 RepID=UPI0020A48338|nr:type 2 lanthipeptide synthetase LanM family protein [Actinomadura rupiterrae]MCP2335947.1 type 2 lantibiotic biosynthesis protein LanM [Actinomadura rupiterrae]
MNPHRLDLAARAANLEERRRAVHALGPPQDPPDLTEFDTWLIARQAAKLAERGARPRARTRAGRGGSDREALTALLTAYRGHELLLTGPDSSFGRLLDEQHAGWLPTYRAALDALPDKAGDPQDESGPEPWWRAPEVFHGRYAIVCAPFLAELGRRMDAVLAEDGGGGPEFDARIADDFQGRLLDRFALAMAWAVETDAKAYCAEHGIDPEAASTADFTAHLDATFADADGYHRFFLDFPVLARWLAHVTALLAEHGRELVTRLRADADEVGEVFFGRPVTNVLGADLGRGDDHAGSRGVVVLDVATGDRPEKLVYKPRCLKGEAALQRLLERLRRDGVLGFASRHVLPKDGYGYEALIPPGRNDVPDRAGAAAVYAELGGYLALFFVLGGGDLHFENILVADGHAFVCDGETVLGAVPDERPDASGTVMDSVFRTGLIEWPSGRAGAEGSMRLSGYAGGGAYELPVRVPRLDERGPSFAASVRHVAGVRVDPGAANRVFAAGELTHAEDFATDVAAGFDAVYRWFVRQGEGAAELVRDLFAGARVRFLNWSTQIYGQLLSAARHPRCLMDPVEVDLLIDTVRHFPRVWDHDMAFPDREAASMWRMDIPLFDVPAEGVRVTHDRGAHVELRLAASPLDVAAERIRGLTEEDRRRQRQYIAAGLAGGDVANEDFAATCVEQAEGVALRLCAEARPHGAPWTSYIVGMEGHEAVGIEADLYNGSAGVALFLAYLNDLSPRPEFERTARLALAHALESTDAARIGAYTGRGGLIYTLVHLHRLWDERDLLDHAAALADGLAPDIERDLHLDVYHGVAGLIPVLLALADATGGHGTDLALRCAEHLMRNGNADGDALSWSGGDDGAAMADLTGFAHGAGGIGWALATLGRRIGRDAYTDAAYRAFAYEARHFDEVVQDWYDLRSSPGGPIWRGRHFANAWCNGAAGIGLSRLATWDVLGRTDDDVLRDARCALAATVRNFPRLMNDTLCHGRSGNAELLLRHALLAEEPAFRVEANLHAQNQWRNLADARPGPESGFFPGLMLGMAGFGLHFLRLAHPGRVPSVLLLDPPSRPEE